MIALGLLVEAIAAIAVIIGLVLGDDGVGVLWAGIAIVLAGLVLTMIGVSRARPPLRAWLTTAAPGDRS